MAMIRNGRPHVSFYLDEPTFEAMERAAASDDRNKSDWIRAVLKRELRRLGLLEDRPKRKGPGR